MLMTNEIFPNIQSEGFLSGIAMIFIRLQEFSLKGKEISLNMNIEENIKIVNKYPELLWVCITGGEFFKQDICKLIKALRILGKLVAIETNGSIFDYEISQLVQWVTVTINPKGYINPEWLIYANEIKFVISHEENLDLAKNFIKNNCHCNAKLYLQARNNSEEIVNRLIEFICKNPEFMLSNQNKWIIK